MGIAEQLNKGLCFDCNYPLRGLESRHCPECGRAFDPDKPRTFNRRGPIGFIARWLLSPLGSLAHGFTILLCTTSLWSIFYLPFSLYVFFYFQMPFAFLMLCYFALRAMLR